MEWMVAAVLFVATAIRSAFGFGEALVAVPLLVLMMPVEVAAPLAVLVSITVAAVVVAEEWRAIHLRSAVWLLAATCVGSPLGLLLLTAGSERWVKGVLALTIILFSAFSLVSRRQARLADDRHAWAFGLAAGVLGGAYGMNGPPLVMFGALRGWEPQRFRATLQGYFLPASIVAMAGYWAAGLWTPAVTHFYLWGVPAIGVAILLGRVINRRLAADAFLRYVHAGLLAIGVVLLVQAYSR